MFKKNFSENNKKKSLSYLLAELNLLFNCINLKREKVSFLQEKLTTSQAVIRSIDFQLNSSAKIMIQQNLQDGSKLYQIIILDMGIIMVLDIRVGDIVSITSDFNLDSNQIVDIYYEKRCLNLKKTIIIPNILTKKLNYYFDILNIENFLASELENLIKLGFINNIFDFYKVLNIFFTTINKLSFKNKKKWKQILKKNSIKDIHQTRMTEFQKKYIQSFFVLYKYE